MSTSSTRKVRRQAAKKGGAADADEVVVKLSAVRELASSMAPSPEQGRRTPQARIRRWDKVSYNELTFGQLTRIMQDAEAGDTEAWADLTRRMLKTDAHLRSVWDTRTAPIYSARWEVSAAEDAPEHLADDAARLAEACEAMLRQVPDLEKLFAALLDGEGVSFAVAENEWTRGQVHGIRGWRLARCTPIHPRRFAFTDTFELGLYDDGRAVDELREAGWEVEEIGDYKRLARLPASKYVVHTPIGLHDYPTASGLFYAIARQWWVKQWVTKFALAGAEQGANPHLIGKLEQAAPGDDVLDDFHDALENLSSDGVAVLRGGTSIEPLEMDAKGAWEVWSGLLTYMDASISKALLGSTLNVEVGETGGNRSLGESQADTTIRPRMEQSAAQMWATIQRGVFRWVRDLNPHIFDPQTPLPVGRSILAEDPVEIDQIAIDAGVVKKDELRESRGLTAIGGEWGEQMVEPTKPAPAFSATPRVSATEAGDVPLAARPWETAAEMSRALTAASRTSGRSTPPSASKPSE